MRGRQDARIDIPAIDVEAGDPARLLLENGAVMVPVDDQRSHQRSHQRHDDRDCQSEQRRLHRTLPSRRPSLNAERMTPARHRPP